MVSSVLIYHFPTHKINDVRMEMTLKLFAKLKKIKSEWVMCVLLSFLFVCIDLSLWCFRMISYLLIHDQITLYRKLCNTYKISFANVVFFSFSLVLISLHSCSDVPRFSINFTSYFICFQKICTCKSKLVYNNSLMAWI